MLICAIIIILRQGFAKQSGWIYLGLFACIRIGGAVYKIMEIKNPSNSNDIEWALILSSVGLSPLTLASFGLLKRM